MTGLQSVLSVAPHNGEDEGQLIMYSVPVLWPCCIMVGHKRSLCACLPPEPSHIPELLLDTVVPLSEEAPDGPTVPRPQELPEDPKDLQAQAEVPQTLGESSAKEEDEEQRWERERKERQERRQREEEEARERELQELARLERELLMQQVEKPGQEEEIGSKKGGDLEPKQEADDDGEESKGENPLEKYMKMVLEAREKQHAQSPVRAEAGHTSPEAKSLSEEKDGR